MKCEVVDRLEVLLRVCYLERACLVEGSFRSVQVVWDGLFDRV